MSDKRQRFPIGALVKCAYDFEMIFPINFGYDNIEKEYHYGIIIAYEPEQYDGFSNWYDFYVVLCFDGVKRYFADFEIRIFKHP